MKKIILTIGLFILLFGVTCVYAETSIDEVTITGLKSPEVGETVADNLANVAIPEGANYTIEELMWWGSEDGMYFYDMADDYAFEEGIYYHFSVTLRANDGFDFPMSEEGDYTGTITTSDLEVTLTQQDEPGSLFLMGDYIFLGEEETETPTETTTEVTPPNTGITTTNTDNNIIVYISLLGLSLTGLYLYKKLFN